MKESEPTKATPVVEDASNSDLSIETSRSTRRTTIAWRSETETQTCIYELTSQKVLNAALGMLPVNAILSKCERLIRVKVFDEVKNKILNMSHKCYKDPRCDNQYLQRKDLFNATK